MLLKNEFCMSKISNINNKPYALITGASAGIGTAFAELLADKGFNLVLVARRIDRLEKIASKIKKNHAVEIKCFKCDLSKNSERLELLKKIDDHKYSIQTLINNAGYAVPTEFVDSSWEEQKNAIEVLVQAVVHLSHVIIKKMIKNKKGMIINIASTAAHLPESSGSVYSPSKSFLVSYSRSLAMETKEHNIKVCAVCPGLTRTDFFSVLGTQERVERLPAFLWQNSCEVALEGWNAANSGKVVYITGLVNKILCVTLGKIPRSLAHKILEHLPKSIKKRHIPKL